MLISFFWDLVGGSMVHTSVLLFFVHIQDVEFGLTRTPKRSICICLSWNIKKDTLGSF